MNSETPLPPGQTTPYMPPPASPADVQPGYSYGNYGGGGARPPVPLDAQIRNWIEVLARGRWYVIGSLLAILIPVTVWTMLQPDVYITSSQLLVQTNPGGSELADVMKDNANGTFNQARPLENELYVLNESESLALRVGEKLVAQGETATGTTLPILRGPGGIITDPALVAERLQGQVEAEPVGLDIDGIRISAYSTSPQEAALIANLYAESYTERTRDASTASITASVEFLEAQVDSVSAELVVREEAVRDYMTSQGAVNLDEESANMVQQQADLQGQLDAARVDAVTRRSRVAELTSQINRLEASLQGQMSAGTDRQLKRKEALLEQRQGELDQIYLADPSLRDNPNPPASVAAIEREIATLEREINELTAELVGDAIRSGSADAQTDGLPRLNELKARRAEELVSLRGSESRIGLLQSRIRGYEADLGQVPTQSVTLAQLMRDRQATEKLKAALESRLQEARVADSAELGFAEIVRRAQVPPTPFGPKRPRNILLGLLLGLALGLTVATARARLDRRLHDPDDLKTTGLPVLGIIPSLDQIVREDFDGATTVEVNERPLDVRLTTLLSPMSQPAESFRALRTAVQFSRPDQLVKTVLVTSASPSEGKSTVAMNLAVVMAQDGRKTVLVDADLRRPRVHKAFGIRRQPGLVDFLFMGADGGAHGQPLVPGVADDLDVLPAGRAAPNPAELLGSRAFRELLNALGDHYDVVIIDAPPVLAATDPVLISTQTDATILVARAGQTKDYELQYAVEQLQAVGSRTIGAVLNGFDVSTAYGYKYRYSYGYQQKYSYGYDDKT